MNLKNEPTIDVAPVHQWFEILSALGVDRNKLLNYLECQESFLLQSDNRIATRCHHAMLHKGAEELETAGIILFAGIKTTAQHLGIVGHLMMNSNTLLDAGNKIVRYASLLSDTGKWSIVKNNNSYDICYLKSASDESYPEIEEASLSSCLAVLRNLSGNKVIPGEVVFTHPDPGYAGAYENVFGLPVKFSGNQCKISISEVIAQQPIPHSQSYSLDLLTGHAETLMKKLGKSGSVTTKVRQLITGHLAQGHVDIEWVSGQLYLSRWTLTRHLKQEGVTFNGLVKEIRRELAQAYLNDNQMSISEVGFLLGYSEPSAFQRAFRGWYQCTPTEFRTSH